MRKETNKQTKRKQQQQQHSPQELHGNTGIDWSHWEQFVLIFSKTADCIVQRAHAFFQSLPIHAQLCISKNRSFFLVFSRSLAHGEKKSYIVLSFDLNPQDNLEQTVTTPSTQLEKAQRMTNRQREKRRGKRKTRPKVKPSQKSKTE